MIAQPEDRRDPALSTMARESIIAAITTEPPHNPSDAGPVTAAIALRAVLPQADALSPHECGLLEEWLDRIATRRQVTRKRWLPKLLCRGSRNGDKGAERFPSLAI